MNLTSINYIKHMYILSSSRISPLCILVVVATAFGWSSTADDITRWYCLVAVRVRTRIFVQTFRILCRLLLAFFVVWQRILGLLLL